MQKTLELLPASVRPSLPWPRFELRSIELPTVRANMRVPDGALQKSNSARTLLMRSPCETRLVDQVATLSTILMKISVEIDGPPDEAVYLQSCFDSGLLHFNYKRFADHHPANFAALALAGTFLQSHAGALLIDVTLEFCKWKQHMLL